MYKSHTGVAFIYLILRALTHVFSEKLHFKGFESGIYGNPPSLKYWARQAALYVLSLTTMKLFVITLLSLFPWLFKVGEWLLSWTWTGEGDSLQVILYVLSLFLKLDKAQVLRLQHYGHFPYHYEHTTVLAH